MGVEEQVKFASRKVSRAISLSKVGMHKRSSKSLLPIFEVSLEMPNKKRMEKDHRLVPQETDY